jgi:hypothetical protein
MFDREKAIAELANALNDEFNQGYLSFDDMVINGFRGLSSMTDEEIMAELEARDISYLFGETDE